MPKFRQRARRRPSPQPPSNWDHVTTPDLITNVARHWRLATAECPECYGATYTHTCAKRGWIGYRRCPNCRMNIINKEATNFTDQAADHMLDAAARRTPLIQNPYTNSQPPSRSTPRK